MAAGGTLAATSIGAYFDTTKGDFYVEWVDFWIEQMYDMNMFLSDQPKPSDQSPDMAESAARAVSAAESVAISDRLAVLAGRENALQAELVNLVVEAIETDEWVGDGIRSVAHWLTLQLGESGGRARRIEDVARRITEFPLIAERFSEGLLSFEQVYAVVTEAPSWADVHAFELIQHTTASQTRRVIRAQFPHGIDPTTGHVANGHVAAGPDTADLDTSVDSPDDDDQDTDHDQDTDEDVRTDPDADADADAGEQELANENAEPSSVFRARLSRHWTAEGRLVGFFDLPAHLGMAVDSALSEAADALFRAGRDHSAADALAEVAARSLRSASTSRADRFKHYIHIDIDAPRNNPDGGAADPIARLTNNTPIPPAVAKYMGCDATMQPIWERDFTPIGAGLATRTISARLRRLITRRDGGCRVPGCDATLVEVHHIQHWANGGVTETWNLVSLCHKHHQMHHDNRLGIKGNPDTRPGDRGELVFLDRHGQQLRLGPQPIPPPTTPTSTPERDGAQPQRYEHPTGERLHLGWIDKWRPPEHYTWLGTSFKKSWEHHQRHTRQLPSNHDAA